MKQFYLVLAVCLALGARAYAQQEGTLGSMRSLPQATYTNPAFVPEQTVFIGLPGISSIGIHLNSNGLTYQKLKDVGVMDEAISSAKVLSLQSVLKDKNWLSIGTQIDLFSLGFKVNPQLYLRYRANMRSYARVMLPRDLTLLADDEFMERVNSVTLAPSANLLAYFENSIGASYTINHKLTVGANLKRLNGLTSVYTDKLQLNISSVPDQDMMEIEGELLAYTSGEATVQDDFDYEDHARYRSMLSNNGGWAADLGITYQITNKLQLGLSVLDLGAIKWRNNAKEYRTDKTSFTTAKVSGENGNWDAFFNDVSMNLEPVGSAVPSFRTGLPTRMYLSAAYALHPSTHASVNFLAEQYKGRTLLGFTAALHKEFGRILGTSLSYSAVEGTLTNIGGGLSLRLSPFQLYVVTDNLMAINYKNTKNANVRLGMNLVFGNIKKPTKLPY